MKLFELLTVPQDYFGEHFPGNRTRTEEEAQDNVEIEEPHVKDRNEKVRELVQPDVCVRCIGRVRGTNYNQRLLVRVCSSLCVPLIREGVLCE